MELTISQSRALCIIYDNGGEGVFDRKGRLLVRGEAYAFQDATMAALLTGGYMAPSGVKRIQVTDIGREHAKAFKAKTGYRFNARTAGPGGMIERYDGAE